MKRLARQIVSYSALLLAWQVAAKAQLAPCYAGFEISAACITARGLDQKAAVYRRKIAEAMMKLGASYQITLRLINHPVEAGYDPEGIGDVFTEVVRNEEMQNQSFIINVTADFLERQPEILFEASSLHEVCHIINDDLAGYHRNGSNVEVAEEHCVLDVVGESRYSDYLKAYAAYQHWDTTTHEKVLQKVKDVVLVPAPSEKDVADAVASDYFRDHADGRERLVVYNGELHDVTLCSTRDTIQHDPEKLNAIIAVGKPMIFFHNHSAEGGRPAMFPSHSDFGAAALFSFLIYQQHPHLPVEFRVLQLGAEETMVSYGFEGMAVEKIQNMAKEYRAAVAANADPERIIMSQNLLDYHLDQDSFTNYLQHACPGNFPRLKTKVCATRPQYFLWPNDQFFIHDRPQ